MDIRRLRKRVQQFVRGVRGKDGRALVLFRIAAHGEVIFIHRVETRIAVPCLVEVDAVHAFIEFRLDLRRIVAKSVIGAVRDDRIGGLVLAFPDRTVADLCGNGFRRHFAAVNRADDAVTVSCRNHIHRNRTRQDESLFNGLVAVAVADGDVAFGHARLKHRTVRAGCADDDRIGVVGAESLRSEFLADSECAFMIEQ